MVGIVAASVNIAIKCFPIAEQVAFLAIHPDCAGIYPCASHPVLGIPL
jgi:hypothetical protein